MRVRSCVGRTQETLSDRVLTLLNRATEDVAQPPSQDTLQSLSNLPTQHTEAALDWMRRRLFQTDSLVVRHKTLVTLRVMCENCPAVLEALKASDVARLDIEGMRSFDVPGSERDAFLARPVQLVREEAEAIMSMTVEQGDVLTKTKARGQQVARVGLELLTSPRKSSQSPRRNSPPSPFKEGGDGGDPAWAEDEEQVRERSGSPVEGRSSLSPVGRVSANRDAAITAATVVGKKAIGLTKGSASFTIAAAQQVKQDAEKAKADWEGAKGGASKPELDDTAVDIDALLALTDTELDEKLSEQLLTLLNRCTADEPKPPPSDALRNLSDTIGAQSAEGRALIVEWLRRRSLTPGNALVTHKSLITVRVLLENARPAVKPKLVENGLILSDIEALAQYDEADAVAGDKPAEMVREVAASVLSMAQAPDQSDLEATATKARAGASRFTRLGMRKSKAALGKANEKASGLRASLSAVAGGAGAGGGPPRDAAAAAAAAIAEEPAPATSAAQESIAADGANEAAESSSTLTPSAEEAVPPDSSGEQDGAGGDAADRQEPQAQA